MSATSEPRVPQAGVISSFSYADGIGRIRLDDGTELKLGSAPLRAIVSFDQEERPLVGVRVVVTAIGPHPLGGLRATELRRAEKEVAFTSLKTIRDWETALGAAGLARKHVGAITGSVRLATRLTAKSGPAAVGTSKLGGDPDLPADFEWPTRNELSLVFVCQLRLEDISRTVRADLRLPAKGLLSFFLGSDEPDGSSPCCVVSLFEPPTRLIRRVDEASFDEHALSSEEIAVPPPPEIADALVDEDRDAIRVYGAAYADHCPALGEPTHWVGGHALPVQGIVEAAGERLLLQLDSDSDLEMNWSDAGRLYFLIQPVAGLASVRCELQSS